MPLTREGFRQKILTDIDALLARTWVVTGDNRKLLQMARSIVASATEAELDRMMALYPGD